MIRFRAATIRLPCAVLGAALVLAAGCGSVAPGPADRTPAAPGTLDVPSPTPQVPATSNPPVPRPSRSLSQADEPIPGDPAALARVLARTTFALRAAIDDWRSGGGVDSWPPPRPVVLLALFQQRIYRELDQDPTLAGRVIARLPDGLASEARTDVAAGMRLFSLAHRPTHRTPVALRTEAPLPARVLLGYYREAQRRFHVSWTVLAAVNYIESKFGRVVSASSAGAQGPMQFIPSTWAAYGLGGDVHDPHDAILGAANYLHASGAPGDYARAVRVQPRAPVRVRRAPVRAPDGERPPRVLRVLQLAGVRPHGDRGPAAHRTRGLRYGVASRSKWKRTSPPRKNRRFARRAPASCTATGSGPLRTC
ncbi:MAG: lytic transglycosylase domain-containing protein [Actinomycetota bacterium]|nr:lytic transglycosylase domain-containing protein [Actinomycetota bacterium]